MSNESNPKQSRGLLRCLVSWLDRRKRERCEAAGHVTKTEQSSHLAYPSQYEFRSVADKVTEERTFCNCGAVDETKEIDRSSIQSLSMPDSQWEKLRVTGRLAS